MDISERMIEKANERIKGEKVKGNVEFIMADAKNIPLKDNIFDVAICESVITFIKDKQKAINEIARIIKPGGCIGLNEETLLKIPPKDVIDYLSKAYDIKVEILTSNSWKEILRKAGLKNVIVQEYEFKGGFKRLY